MTLVLLQKVEDTLRILLIFKKVFFWEIYFRHNLIFDLDFQFFEILFVLYVYVRQLHGKMMKSHHF